MRVLRSFFNIVADDLAEMHAFYVDWLGFAVRFKSEWFLHLASPQNDALELGVLNRGHHVVPKSAAGAIQGGVLTIVVEDVDAVHRSAEAAGILVDEPPRDMFYGQRRMLVRDPAGTVVDVSSECAPDAAWVATLRQTDSGGYEEA